MKEFWKDVRDDRKGDVNKVSVPEPTNAKPEKQHENKVPVIINLKDEIKCAIDICEKILRYREFENFSADDQIAQVHSKITGAIIRLKQAEAEII